LDAKSSSALYKLEGVYLNNLQVVKAMDKTLSAANLKSNVINANLKAKDESIELKANNKMLTEEEFEAAQNYAVKLATKAIEEILEGNITPSPYSENEQMSACTYCKFNGICKFSKTLNNASRKVNSRITINNIKEALQSE
jgi:ATP-dependent helicase/nuclease subunit B